jgi:hypothetical protein
MFEPGDEIVCINNSNNKIYLIIGKIYIVDFIILSQQKKYDFLEVKGSNYIWKTKDFLSLQDYRKLKLKKLKERICFQKVM